MFLPRALSTLTDARNALDRLTEVSLEMSPPTHPQVFEAEVMEKKNNINPNLSAALRVENATFRWSSIGGPETEHLPMSKSDAKKAKETEKTMPIASSSSDTLAEPFSIVDLNLEIPRGSLTAIVGSVGSGKSSLLQGVRPTQCATLTLSSLEKWYMSKGLSSLAAGLRTVSRTVRQELVGHGNTALTTAAWIQNATLRDNVVFGQEWDEHRYWTAIRDASLVPDLELLPDGDLTEVGLVFTILSVYALTFRSARKASIYQEVRERSQQPLMIRAKATG